MLSKTVFFRYILTVCNANLKLLLITSATKPMEACSECQKDLCGVHQLVLSDSNMLFWFKSLQLAGHFLFFRLFSATGGRRCVEVPVDQHFLEYPHQGVLIIISKTSFSTTLNAHCELLWVTFALFKCMTSLRSFCD